jgi:peptidylprolyl isomerase
MDDRSKFLNAFGLLLIGVFVAWYFWPTAPETPSLAGNGPGPDLEIEIAGSVEGKVLVDLLSDVAPQHVARIIELTIEGRYDGVVFHRVIPAFMAQTGDVTFGLLGEDNSRAGMGGSDKPDLVAEFSEVPFERGVVGMARTESPDSANSQFFIVTAPARHLDGQYTVVGRVIQGLEVVDALKAGTSANNGTVEDPDYIASARILQ